MQLQAGIAFSAMGAVVTFWFGMWSESLTFLVLVMVIDYLTGITAAIKEGSGLHSQVGFWGLLKKGLTLLIILIAHRVDILLGSNAIMGGAIYFYLANELLSVIENYGRIGLPLPPKLVRVVKVLRDRAGEPENKSDDCKKDDI